MIAFAEPRTRIASWTLPVALALAAHGGLAAQEDRGEFSAHGVDVVRIESEAKLRVPLEATEEVWVYLQQHFKTCSWLDERGAKFTSTFGDEQFEDVYYDTPSLQLAAMQSGIRHRSRVVMSGSAMRKDGRQLVQIKLNRGDDDGLDRSEIKFTVDPSPGQKGPYLQFPLLALVDEDHRETCRQRIEKAGIDPFALRRVVEVDQNRRRVYVADQGGAFATVTLDACSIAEWGATARWTEIEVELNEIRYTEANEADRAWMQGRLAAIQKEIQTRFPAIVQDQTPKYNKALAAIEAGSWLPVRKLIGAGIDHRTVIALSASVGLLLGYGCFVALRRTAQKRREALA